MWSLDANFFKMPLYIFALNILVYIFELEIKLILQLSAVSYIYNYEIMITQQQFHTSDYFKIDVIYPRHLIYEG